MAQISSGVYLPDARRTSSLLCRVIIPFCLLIAILLLPDFASGAAAEPLEYQIQAVFLLNFTKFIEWPPESLGQPYSTFNICILGDNPFGTALDQVVSGESVTGRKMIVRRIEHEPEAGSCQIVFTTSQDADAGTFARLGRGVLTVGEGETFVRNGGMIGFVLENRRVRFEINRQSAEAAGLRISSRLLAVARSVTR